MRFTWALPVLLVAGCSVAPTQTSDEPVADTPAFTCIDVSPDAIAGIQWGLDDRNGAGFTVTEAAAIKNPSSDASWFVAGRFDGPGADRQVGVWSTIADPAADGEFAYNSVDGFAAEFSSYVQPPNYSAALDGVDEVKSCLN